MRVKSTTPSPPAPPKVNIESKNNLARLLAVENIWIQHRKVATASFDLVNRVLTFPMWKAMSDELYTMLAGHECGHALWSEKVNVLDIGKRIDPKNPYLAAMYWNIVEDVRIERMIKTMYPGLTRTFTEAYKELFDKDMFKTQGKNLDDISFADRINLFYKIGSHITLTFTQQEQVLLDKAANTTSAEDVVDLAKEIYLFAKHQQLQPKPLDPIEELLKKLKQQGQSSNPGGENEDDEDDDGSGMQTEVPIFNEDGSGGPSDDPNVEPSDDNKEDEGDKTNGEGDKGKDDKGKGKEGEGQDGKDPQDGGDGKGKDGKEGGNEGKDGEGTPKPGKKDGKPKKADGKIPGSGKEALKPVDPGPPPAPFTQQAFDEKLLEYNDKNALPIEYITLPKPIMKNILVDFEDVHANIRKHNFAKPVRNSWYYGASSSNHDEGKMTKEEVIKFNTDHFAGAEKSYHEFRDASMPKINYIFQQFEMKKQADRYKRTRQHKTGSVDPLRLWAFKTEEDLFKTVAIVTDAKNHGLMFVVDWSGSMQSSMAGTIEQMIELCIFCRKAGIPFEVYALTTGSRKAFSSEPGNLVYADNFRMRNYLSSRMTTMQFHAACVNLFALMPGRNFVGGPTEDNLIGCTPLDEAIITTIELIKEFRQRTHAQVVNAIFMTDGDANTVNGYINSRGAHQSMNHQTRYLIDDRATHKVYDFVIHEMTPTMLKILRDRQNINVVGFYIGGRWDGFFSNLDNKERKKLEKEFSENGFVIATAWGFSELYITKGGDQWKVKETKIRPTKIDKGTDEYEKALVNNFAVARKAVLKQRVLLDSFIRQIA